MGLVIIHVGKCAGSTLREALTINNIDYKLIHLKRAIFNKNDKYVIVLRNPISRLISAFNWRYKLVILDRLQEIRFPGERETLLKYKDVNTFSEHISDYDKVNNYIHHVYENINFYLGKFLKKAKKENILGIITQENLNEDTKKIFNIDIGDIEKRKNDAYTYKFMSHHGRVLLKKYLHKDYKCIDKLFKMGCLTKEQYKILSK
jgi:hypothetical protein